MVNLWITMHNIIRIYVIVLGIIKSKASNFPGWKSSVFYILKYWKQKITTNNAKDSLVAVIGKLNAVCFCISVRYGWIETERKRANRN